MTTVGYGNVFPVTSPGKITLLLLMIFGTLFIWSYMGFLVSALIAPEIDSLEKEIHEMERDLEALKNLK